MATTYTFNSRGVTVSSPTGDVILNAGDNITILPSGDLITFSVQLPPNVVLNNVTPYLPPKLSDANAPKGSVYYSTDANKLVFRDYGGTVHPLY